MARSSLRLLAAAVTAASVALVGCSASDPGEGDSTPPGGDAGAPGSDASTTTNVVGAAPGRPPSPEAGASTGNGGDAATPADAAPGASSDAAVDAGPASAFTIPVTTMLVGANAAPFLFTTISIGGSPPVVAVIDTGSVGLRIVEGTIDDSFFTDTGAAAAGTTYGGAVTVQGEVESAAVTIGGVATRGAIDLEKVTQVSCTDSAPNCASGGGDASAYRFFGTSAPAVLGVGMRATKYLASPLAAVGTHGQYVFAMDALGSGTGSLLVDPTPATIARFAANTAQLAMNGTIATGGTVGWTDTTLPFTINGYSGTAIFDCGAGAYQILISDESDYRALGVPADSTTIPAGTQVTETFLNDLTFVQTVGNPPVAGDDLFRLSTTGARGSGATNLGVTPFFKVDVMYDYVAGTLGVAVKR